MRSSAMSEVEAVASADAAPAFGRRRDVMIVLPGLMLALILAMLDQLVVSTALPRIVGDLGGLNHLSWVVTAYVLASTITTPLYGKLGDLYGRKKLLMIAIVVFLIGSALSGLSHSMDQLIAFRALQGLGAAGLLVGAYITDALSWQWIFYINMPIGGAALVYLWLTLHVPGRRVQHRVEYLGAAL